jgi:hypothetical protein
MFRQVVCNDGMLKTRSAALLDLIAVFLNLKFLWTKLHTTDETTTSYVMA